MSDSFQRPTRPSVLKFMLLPQFGQMLRSSPRFVPIFIRTIAGLFLQTGLIPPTHPALSYGTPGVEKIGFTKLMGDVWYRLRNNPSTSLFHWSVFSSVALMAFVVISSLVLTVFNLSAVFIGSAAAQVFSLPHGDTSYASLGLAGNNSGVSFDRTFPAPGTAQGDFAISILNKMLRFGASPENYGSPMQNATKALMQTYTTGVLVIAGVMLFWLIVSLVVDVARTGQVGGGRHNLVWAPIRIIFAFALLAPMNGFVGGQYAVMKLAEWGSNFGSNGWAAYIANAGLRHTLPPLPEQAHQDLIKEYTRMWTCRVAFNGYTLQSTGLDEDELEPQLIRMKPVSSANSGTQDFTYAFTNDTGVALCGSLTVPGTTEGIEFNLQADMDSTDPIRRASAAAKRDMLIAWRDIFLPGATIPGTGVRDTEGTPISALANDFACAFVRQHIWGDTDGIDNLTFNCGGDGEGPNGNSCGAGEEGGGEYPDMTCIDDMESGISTTISAAAEGVREAYQEAINEGLDAGGSAYTDRGWADMGAFYKSISEMTVTANTVADTPIRINPPGYASGAGEEMRKKMGEIMAKLDDWWNTVPNGQEAPDAPQKPKSCGWNPVCHVGSALSGAWHGITGAFSAIGDIVEFVKEAISTAAAWVAAPFSVFWDLITNFGSYYSGNGFMQIPNADEGEATLYPLAILSHVGETLVRASLALFMGATVIELTAAAIPFLSIGPTMAASGIATLLNTLSGLALSCGAILVYYLPLLPFIRVAHAVLVWMIVVFEAVMLAPIAALSFLSTVGEGWDAKHTFVQWLDIIFRPILTVIGFVGSLLIFNTFFSYVHAAFTSALPANMTQDLILRFFGIIVHAVLFTMIMYTAANTSFKLLTLIPDAFFRWLPGGQPSGATGAVGESDFSGAVGKLAGVAHQSLSAAKDAGVAQQKKFTSMAENAALTAAGAPPGSAGGPTATPSSGGSSGSSPSVTTTSTTGPTGPGGSWTRSDLKDYAKQWKKDHLS